MANTFTQIHFQAIFAVQNRESLIHDNWRINLYKYISTIIRENGHKPLAINGMPDHLHIVFGMRPAQSLADLMQHIKADSSGWINKAKLVRGKFNWQDGYAALTYSKSQLPRLIKYVENQQVHHKKKTFLEEFRRILEKSEIEYNPKYLFHEIENDNKPS